MAFKLILTLLTSCCLMSLQKVKRSHFWHHFHWILFWYQVANGWKEGWMDAWQITKRMEVREFMLTRKLNQITKKKLYILYLWLTTSWLYWAVLPMFRFKKWILACCHGWKWPKRKQLSPFIKGCLSSVLCPLDLEMHQQFFKSSCL